MSIDRRKARTGERVIIKALFVCAVLSVAVTVGIVAVLLADTVQFFRHSGLVEFLTGTVWAPGQGAGPAASSQLDAADARKFAAAMVQQRVDQSPLAVCLSAVGALDSPSEG